MAAVFDAVGPSSAGTSIIPTGTTGGSLSWNHVCSGANRLLCVGVAVGYSPDTGVSTTATFGGVSMTSRGVVHCGSGTTGYVQFFSLTAPATGSTNNVVVTLTGGSNSATNCITAGSVSFTGANQTTPFGTFATAVDSGAGSAAPTITVGSTTSGNPVIDAVAWGSGAAATPGAAPQIQRWQRVTNGASRAGDGAQSTEISTGGNVTLSYTIAVDNWGIIAAEVLPAAITAAPVPFLTQYSSFH